MTDGIIAPFVQTPGTIYLHKNQAIVYRSKSRFKVVAAGRRFGKTILAGATMIRYSQVKKRLIWYVAPSYRMAKQIMWPVMMEMLPQKWIKKINETTLSITLRNGTRIELKGADNPDSLRGVGVHYLVMDEVQDIDPVAWTKVLRPTLASTGGHALFIGTSKSYNFLYDLYMRGQDEHNQKNGIWMSWQFPTSSSPFIPKAEIEAARRDMDEKSFAAEFEASFENMAGRAYYTFDRKVHVKPCPFNPDLPIWVGQDFNLSPMSSVVLQPQPNGEVWCVGEISKNGSNTLEVSEELERRFYRWQQNVTIFPDPASNTRQHARGETDLDIFREKGFKKIRHRLKHPTIADRVNAVCRMFRAADGTVRMYIDPCCEKLIESVEQTVYKPESREIDKDQNIEHMGDALGYPIELQFPIKRVQGVGLSL